MFGEPNNVRGVRARRLLVAAPQVKLIFLNIKDGGDPFDEASQFQPSVVRTQAPTDIHAYAADNIDHLAAASFTGQAISIYHGPNGTGRVLLEQYRDYAIANLPDNLSFTQRQDKRSIFLAYEALDPNARYFHYHTRGVCR